MDESEVIIPFEMTCEDSYGKLIHVTGIDVINQRVIYRRPGYPYECVCPRRDFKKKFKKVKDEH